MKVELDLTPEAARYMIKCFMLGAIAEQFLPLSDSAAKAQSMAYESRSEVDIIVFAESVIPIDSLGFGEEKAKKFFDGLKERVLTKRKAKEESKI